MVTTTIAVLASLSIKYTLSPFDAKYSTMQRPMPLAPPVITKVLLIYFCYGSNLLSCHFGKLQLDFYTFPIHMTIGLSITFAKVFQFQIPP